MQLHTLTLRSTATTHNVQHLHGLVASLMGGKKCLWAYLPGMPLHIQSETTPYRNERFVAELQSRQLPIITGTATITAIVHPIKRNNSRETPIDATEWATPRLHENGFEVTTVATNSLKPAMGYRLGKGLALHRELVQIKGRITDPEKFNTLRAQGLGRAKAYGCGLMLVTS